jgi:thiamine-phosphate pyrophosphorylase
MTPFRFPSRLYPIIDTLGDERRSYTQLAHAILAPGTPFVQLRAKHLATGAFVQVAREIKALTDAAGAQLIINDRADIARLVDAAGVHLGQEDLPVAAARAILGQDKIVGFSTHNVAQAEAAARSGLVDYIGFGPIFSTASKERPDPVQGLEGLRRVRRAVTVPIVAIGGIAAATLPAVLDAGADAAAMIGEIVRAADVTAAVRRLLERAGGAP